jgi:TfoX/Sxy family transcriptional regulator of competence genes
MAYNEKLTAGIREALEQVPNVEEKRMFRGVTFMVNDKMCITAGDTRIMCRIDPSVHDETSRKKGCETVKMKSHKYKRYVYVSKEEIRTKKNPDYRIRFTLEFNKLAKSSRKKKK